MNSSHTVFDFSAGLSGKHIHFTGIKGTGMAAFVEICIERGAKITGSDVSDIFYTDELLAKVGISNITAFSAQNITNAIDAVIYSSAYKIDINPELIEAQRLGIPIMKYTDALGSFSRSTYSAGIAGVHGKTTTTGLAGTIIKALHFPAQVLAGSVIRSFGNTCTVTEGKSYFIAETCEYQRHFMSFHPKKIVLTSVESDHQDFFPTYESIRDAFVDYIKLLPRGGQLIYCADDSGAVETALIAANDRPDIELIPYGVSAAKPNGQESPYTVVFGAVSNAKQYFRLAGFNQTFSLSIPGHHTVRDAAAAVALAAELYKTEYGRDPDAQTVSVIAEAVSSYLGSKRRSEIIGRTCEIMPDGSTVQKGPTDIIFIDDYGHHPTAVKTTLQGYRSFYPDRVLIVDFMSHTFSRTHALLEQFASSFTAADEVILHKIYGSAREVYDGTVTGRTLYERTINYNKNTIYFDEIMDALDYTVKRLSQPLPADKTGYVFVTMGAGDNWKLGRAVLTKIQGN